MNALSQSLRVLVIQDASSSSSHVCTSAIKMALTQMFLHPGDEITFLAILDWFTTPMGYKVTVDSGSFLAANKKIVEKQVARIKEDFHFNPEIMKLSEFCQEKKMAFHIEVFAGPFPSVASNAARNLGATWLILTNRQMSLVKHFVRLPYGIYRIRSDNSIQKLKDPTAEKIQQKNISYNEASLMMQEFKMPICSVCNNRRPKVGWKKTDFSYAELYKATLGFSQKNFLSEGRLGSVFKGYLNGIEIAVKQHQNARLLGEKEFKSKVNVLSKARHENVVMLLGSCSEGNHRLLVYEYVCNGSLDQHLSEHSPFPLSWEERTKVAIGAAKGLLYLHENNIIHRDLRPSNILITHDHQPLLGDFGLARSLHEESTLMSGVFRGLGYLAPEFAECGIFSAKTDVYSFGIVMLQLVTGMRTIDRRLGGRSLVGWARPLLREKKYAELIDERILNSHDYHQLFFMIQIAEKCLSRDPQKRLNMTAVVNALSLIVLEGNTHACGIMINSPESSDSFYNSSSSSDSDESSDSDMQGYNNPLKN